MTIAFMIAMPVNVFAADTINDQQVEENISFEIRDTNDLAVLSEELDKWKKYRRFRRIIIEYC